jgi:hypothetical protein
MLCRLNRSTMLCRLNRYLVEIKIPIALWRSRCKFEPAHHVGSEAEPAGKVSMAQYDHPQKPQVRLFSR